MPITLTPGELYAAFVEVRGTAGPASARLVDDPPAAFLFDVFDSMRQEGLRSLRGRGLAEVNPHITIDAFLSGMLRTVMNAEWQIDVRVEVCGDAFGMAVPYVSGFGFDAPDSIWTTVRSTDDGGQELSSLSKSGAISAISQAVEAAYEGSDDGSRLSVFVSARARGKVDVMRVTHGQTVPGSVEGCGTSARFVPTGPARRWHESLLGVANY